MNAEQTPEPTSRSYAAAQTLFGHTMQVPQADTIGDSIRKHGLYDRKGVAMMNAVLAQIPQAVVLDIGANIGNHALAMSTVASRVYCFEPQPRVFDVLQQNVETNRIDNIELYNLGLSNQEQELDLFIPASDNLGAATLRTELKADNAIIEPIRLVRGDEFVAGLDLPRLDLIKVDVEGFEIQVLEGLAATIDRFLPIIFMEWDQDLTRQEAADSPWFQQLLASYQAYEIGTNFDRELWRGKFAGALRRVAYKAAHKRCWLFREADLNLPYGNLVLVPGNRVPVIEAVEPQVL